MTIAGDGSELSERQRAGLDAFRRLVAESGMPPTIVEVGRSMGLSQPNHAKRYLDVLVELGHLTRAGGGSRAYRLPKERAGITVPIKGVVAAGAPVAQVEPDESVFYIEKFLMRPGTFLLRVRGDSMKDLAIQDGDLIHLRPTATAEDGEQVVMRVGDGYTLKTLRRRGRTVTLMPENADHQPIRLTPSVEAELVGVYNGLLRFFDEH